MQIGFSTLLRTLLLSMLLQTSLTGLAQQEIPLYNGVIPNSTNAVDEEYTKVSNDGERVIYKGVFQIFAFKLAVRG